MIIAFPNDGRGLLYHILDLNGQTVHAYRDFDAALRSREGDQRIAILQEPVNGKENRWLTDAPTPDRESVRDAALVELRRQVRQDETKADELEGLFPDLAERLRAGAERTRETISKLEGL